MTFLLFCGIISASKKNEEGHSVPTEKMTLKKYIDKEYTKEKRRARATYRARLREAKAAHSIRLEDYYLKTGAPRPVNPPKRAVLEEIGNSVTHGLGAIFAVYALYMMLRAADGAREITSAVIYFFGMFTAFSVSCIYHALPYGSAAKRLFRRFDYSSIYLLIGATFAPVLLAFFNNRFGITFFIVQWAVIALGITLVAVFGPSRLRYIHIPLYVVLGWSALMLLPGMIAESYLLAVWILAGGIAYTLGILPYAIKVRASHFIWHFFVLLGAVLQCFGIYVYVFLG